VECGSLLPLFFVTHAARRAASEVGRVPHSGTRHVDYALDSATGSFARFEMNTDIRSIN
jgi:hypothetical protein